MSRGKTELEINLPSILYGEGDRLSLLKMILDDLDHPDNNFQIIHLAGTNGKGSTSTMIAKILEEMDYKVGLFTSPNVVSEADGIKVNGINISQDEMNEAKKILDESLSRLKISAKEISYFETIFLLAVIHFSLKKIDYLVLECGLGGELDATNAVSNSLYEIFTKIDFDHMAILGDSLEEIATTKSKIIKKNSRVLISDQQNPLVVNIVKKESLESGARFIDKPVKNIKGEFSKIARKKISFEYQEKTYIIDFSLAGTYQQENLQLVLNWYFDFIKINNLESDTELLSRALGNINLSGRFEKLYSNPEVIIDGAHNPNAIRQLVDTLKLGYKQRSLIIILGFLKDKDVEKSLQILSELKASFIVTEPDNERKMAAQDLENKLFEHNMTSLGAYKQVDLALDMAISEASKNKNSLILIMGSLYLVNPVQESLAKLGENHEN